MLRLHGQYAYMMAELADPRADSLPLMSSVWPTIVLCCSYVYLITVAGPRSYLLLLVEELLLKIFDFVREVMICYLLTADQSQARTGAC